MACHDSPSTAKAPASLCLSAAYSKSWWPLCQSSNTYVTPSAYYLASQMGLMCTGISPSFCILGTCTTFLAWPQLWEIHTEISIDNCAIFQSFLRKSNNTPFGTKVTIKVNHVYVKMCRSMFSHDHKALSIHSSCRLRHTTINIRKRSKLASILKFQTWFLPRDAMHPRYLPVPCVCLSVTSRSSTKTAKCRITQTTPHDSPETLVFWRQRPLRNSTGVTPYSGTKCRWGWSKSATFDNNNNNNNRLTAFDPGQPG